MVAKLGVIACTVWFIINLAVFGLFYYGTILYDFVTRADRATHRWRVARWQVLFMGGSVFAAIGLLMRLKISFDLPRRTAPGPSTEPLIIIANHRSFLDIAVVMAYLRRMEHYNIRWVLKRNLRYAPFMGASCKTTGCAFVARDKSGQDKDVIVRECAISALEDGASVIMFPEGTRFTPRKARRHSQVLSPRSGGFKVLREVLPGYRVLSLTIRWGSAGDCSSLLRSAKIFGAGLRVSGEIHDLSGADPEAWLNREWERKNAALSSTGLLA